jgi:hypothetical protein
MAYSDYGGYAYKNGQRVVERSDAVLSPEGIQSTPGAWPGWTIEAGRSGGSYHALLGDGPIFVGLYKQSSLSIHRLGEELAACDLMENPPDGVVLETTWNDKPYRYIDTDYFKEKGLPCVLNVDGVRIEVQWVEDDNHYMHVRMEQPDGSIWCGFSGYGVGAGLEDAGYGYSTSDCENRLLGFWPDAVKQVA